MFNILVNSYLPATDADLHQVFGGHVGDVGRVEVRRGVHPLVEVCLLDVGVAIDVDDANVLRRHGRDPSLFAGKRTKRLWGGDVVSDTKQKFGDTMVIQPFLVRDGCFWIKALGAQEVH